MRVAYRTLAVEKAFDFANCGILIKFGIDPNEEEEDAVDEVEDNEEEDEEIIDGECTPRQLQKAYKK